MSHPIAEALREGLTRILPELQQLTERNQEPWLVWRREGPQSWRGEQVLRPALGNILRASSDRIAEEAARVRPLVQSMYPDFMGQVGLRRSNIGRPANDPAFPLGSTVLMVWNEQNSFRPEPAVIELAVTSVVHVLETKRIRARFSAPLENFRSDVENLRFAPGLILRRLSVEELTDYYGGPHWRIMFLGRPDTHDMNEFVLEGEREEALIFHSEELDQGTWFGEVVHGLLDRAILAFRAFKQGPIGYNFVRYRPIGFCPAFLGDTLLPNVHIPPGQYHLARNDAERLISFADMVVRNEDPALETGCRRLSDAQVRTRPEDQILDAVVGLEAVLLAGLARQDRRGELKFRFSINYAVLVPEPQERLRRYKIAKDLYDLRSTVAHGGALEKPVRVGKDKGLTAQQAAGRACDGLRDVLWRLLPEARRAPYRSSDFWENAYFGVKPAGEQKS